MHLMDTPHIISGETDDQRDIRMNKDVAAFSYVWIMSVLIYASRKDSKFIRYHSKQGVVLFIFSIIFGLIPLVGKYLLFLTVAGMLLGFVHAAQGEYADVPIAGELAKGTIKPADLVKMIVDVGQKIVAVFRDIFQSNKEKPKEDEKKPEPPVDNPPVNPVP